MNFSRPARRTPLARLVRLLAAGAAVALVVTLLSLVPYRVLREERARIFGEEHTMGLVESVRSEAVPGDGLRFFVDYKYVDRDGLLRWASARVDARAWGRLTPGARLRVSYARSRPELARIPGQEVSAFRAWLWRVLD